MYYVNLFAFVPTKINKVGLEQSSKRYDESTIAGFNISLRVS